MRMTKVILRDMAASFKGMNSKTITYKDPIDLLSDKEGRAIIKESFGLQNVPDNDPRIKTELKIWLDGIGSEDKPANVDAPRYSDINRKHLFVLNGWIGMEDHLRCQAKKYLR
ncbi:hypothetical protein Ct61P_14842 [Colletotrichum tofieldiae]|nr:hypothetical protein Ct61P_14842 [Colletotrichum tofieldiae]